MTAKCAIGPKGLTENKSIEVVRVTSKITASLLVSRAMFIS